MEYGVRLLGIVQKILRWLTFPLFFLTSWRTSKKRLPPILDPLLLLSATEIAEKIRKEEVSIPLKFILNV